MADPTTSPNPTASGAARLRERRRRRHAPHGRGKNVWLILGIVIVFGVGLVLSGTAGVLFETFANRLYGAFAVLLIVILMIEYILLKGRDPSRVYKIELEALRAKRERDVASMRQLEATLGSLDASLQSLLESKALEPDEGAELERLRQEVETARRKLAESP